MFNKSNFCHIASNNRNEQKGSVFIYKTTDTLAQVTQSGYFNEKLIDINLHDLIIHVQYDPVARTLKKSVLIVTERTMDNVETAPILDQTIGDDIADLGDQVQGIEEKIPENASAQNQLATKNQITDLQTALSQGLAQKQDIATAVNYDNITNCITEIPQDIKLELKEVNGVMTLILKAGSKVYVPNGAGVFDKKTTTTDVTTQNLSGYPNGKYLLFDNSDLFGQSLRANLLSSCHSGTSDPLSGVWYNTTENKIRVYSGNTWTGNRTLPLGVVTISNGTISSIDQVFNGFGYIGSTVFVLPGVKGLIPNGRNEDGTLKNTDFITDHISTVTNASNLTMDLWYAIDANGDIANSLTDYWKYDEQKNTWVHDGVSWGANIPFARSYANGGKVENFVSKTTFHAVDYNDFAVLAVLEEKVDTKQDIATAVNYDNITNCITDIPQDIKLELNDGVLTLKAGSKYYKPDGTYVVTTSDYNVPIAWNAAASGIIVIGNDSYSGYAENRQLSGATNPTGLQGNSYLFWNTTEKQMYWTINGGSTWNAAPNCSVPIARVTWGADNKVTSIDEIYNGFGYMGSTVFALPGVKGLIPDGRNADGSLKNEEIVTTNVMTANAPKTPYWMILKYENALILHAVYNTTPYTNSSFWYDEQANILYTQGGAGALFTKALYFATISGTDDGITSFTPKLPFHAVDYSDTDFIAHQAMPSNRYVNLTLPTTDNPITAPADGYLTVAKSATAVGQYFYFINNTNGYTTGIQSAASLNCRLTIPVSKGDNITVYYNLGGSTNTFRFIYANGAK